MFEHLFAPIKIRDMELKNRIILPAMGTRMAAGKQEFSFGRDLLPHAWIRRRRCWLFRI